MLNARNLQDINSIDDLNSSPSIPDEKHISSIPVEEHRSSIPEEEHRSSIPIEEHRSSIPVEEHRSSMAVEEHISSIPVEGHISSMLFGDDVRTSCREWVEFHVVSRIFFRIVWALILSPAQLLSRWLINLIKFAYHRDDNCVGDKISAQTLMKMILVKISQFD